MDLPQIVTGLSDIAGDYDALIVDIWGVMHNGSAPFDGVDDALETYRAQGGKVLLLSNAPRPGTAALKRLHTLGNRETSYDGILTSGDVTRATLNELGGQGKTCCHIGPDKDDDLIAGLDIVFTEMDAADVVVFSGMYDDSNETPDDYAALLNQMKARELPMICPNPDRTVMVGDKIIYCAGAVAEAYETMGGEVMWVGKPHQIVYQRAMAQLAEMTGLDAPRLLAIGDGPKTDIPGAQSAGIDAVFIAGGLAAASGADIDSPEAIAALLLGENTHARYAMRHLVW